MKLISEISVFTKETCSLPILNSKIIEGELYKSGLKYETNFIVEYAQKGYKITIKTTEGVDFIGVIKQFSDFLTSIRSDGKIIVDVKNLKSEE